MLQKTLLTVIIIAYAALGALYAIRTPLWQSPDEPAHFNTIRAIGETGALPILQSGDYNQNYLEQIKAAKFPASMSIDTIRYESYQPPLYYLAATPVYLIARAGGINILVISLRLFSVLLGAILLFVAYNIVHEIFPNDSFLVLATVGALATIPMHIAVTASISNDTASELVLALILWLAIRRIHNNIDDKRFIILGGILFGAALITKTTTYLPGLVLLVGAEFAYSRITNNALRFTNYISLFAISILISAPMFIRNMFTYGITDPLGLARHDSVVIGQPTTAQMISQYGFNHILFDVFAVTFKSFWAQFGWMGVLVNDRIYTTLFVLVGIALLGIVLYAWKIFRQRNLLTNMQWWSIGLLAVMVITAIAAYIGYNFKFFQLQGRYLFPATTAIAFFLVIGLREMIAREYHRIAFAILYVGMLMLDLACLFLFIIPQLRIAN
jgi:hypothetical protein